MEKYISLRAGPQAMSHQKALERLRQDAEEEAGSRAPAQAALPAAAGSDAATVNASTEGVTEEAGAPPSSPAHMNGRTNAGRSSDYGGNDKGSHVVAEGACGGALDLAPGPEKGCSCARQDHVVPCVPDGEGGHKPIDVRACPAKVETATGQVEKAAAASPGAGQGGLQNGGPGEGEEGPGAHDSTSPKAHSATLSEERAASGEKAVAFLLEAGVRSMMGGNAEMGLACFARCEQVLLERVQEAAAREEAAVSLLSQLGTVCGLQVCVCALVSVSSSA